MKDIYPPIEIKYTKNLDKGRGVFALADLEPFTLIAEYIGDVMSSYDIEKLWKDGKLNEDADNSRMILMETKNPKTTLEIIPINYSNIARFLNSIGKKTVKLQNTKSLWTEADGKMLVLLYTTKKVKSGEELLYNYNGYKGRRGEYPTDEF